MTAGTLILGLITIGARYYGRDTIGAVTARQTTGVTIGAIATRQTTGIAIGAVTARLTSGVANRAIVMVTLVNFFTAVVSANGHAANGVLTKVMAVTFAAIILVAVARHFLYV
jgi:hypothetical protein